MTTPEAPILRRVALKRELPDGDYLKKIPAVRHLAAMEYLPLDKAVTILVGALTRRAAPATSAFPRRRPTRDCGST